MDQPRYPPMTGQQKHGTRTVWVHSAVNISDVISKNMDGTGYNRIKQSKPDSRRQMSNLEKSIAWEEEGVQQEKGRAGEGNEGAHTKVHDILQRIRHDKAHHFVQ